MLRRNFLAWLAATPAMARKLDTVDQNLSGLNAASTLGTAPLSNSVGTVSHTEDSYDFYYRLQPSARKALFRWWIRLNKDKIEQVARLFFLQAWQHGMAEASPHWFAYPKLNYHVRVRHEIEIIVNSVTYSSLIESDAVYPVREYGVNRIITHIPSGRPLAAYSRIYDPYPVSIFGAVMLQDSIGVSAHHSTYRKILAAIKSDIVNETPFRDWLRTTNMWQRRGLRPGIVSGSI